MQSETIVKKRFIYDQNCNDFDCGFGTELQKGLWFLSSLIVPTEWTSQPRAAAVTMRCSSPAVRTMSDKTNTFFIIVQFMKKKLLLISSATIVVLAGVFGMKSVMALTNLDALFFENVNALTDAEITGEVCYDTVTIAEAQRVLYCGNCAWVDGKPSRYSSKRNCN